MTNTNQPEQNALGGGCRYYVSMRVAHLFEQALFQWHPPDWCMPICKNKYFKYKIPLYCP